MIRFLSVDDVNRLHERTVVSQGGAPGIRDSGLLDAAVAMPMQTFDGEYLHPDLPPMAAAYHFHICQAHAYVDGNKRTAVLAALAFLAVNGVPRLPSPDELEGATLAVASGRMSKPEIMAWFAERVRVGRVGEEHHD